MTRARAYNWQKSLPLNLCDHHHGRQRARGRNTRPHAAHSGAGRLCALARRGGGPARDLMRPFPAGLMRMWPISTRVNKPENDEPSIIEPIELATDAA